MGVFVEMTGDEQRLFQSFQRIVNQQANMDRGFRRVERSAQRAGRRSERAFGSRALRDIRNYATGLLSVSVAIGAASRAWQTYFQNVRAARQESTRFFQATRPLGALIANEPGAAQFTEAAVRAGTRFGIEDFQLTADVAQAMLSGVQATRPELSVREQRREALRISNVLFQATEIGAPLETALTAEQIGQTLGMQPLQMFRQMIAAGQLSRVSPAITVPAAQASVAFADQDFFAAIVAQIAGSAQQETRTAALAIGEALSRASTIDFAQYGVAEDATREQRLRALYDAGIRTSEQLQVEAGLTQRLARRYLPLLLTEEAMEGRGALTERLQEMAQPGMVARISEQMAQDESRRVVQRDIERRRAEQRLDLAVGPFADQAAQVTQSRLAFGQRLRRAGREQGALGLDLIDEEGEATLYAYAEDATTSLAFNAGIIVARAFRPIRPFFERMEQIGQDLGRAADNIGKSARDLSEGARNITAAPRERVEDNEQ